MSDLNVTQIINRNMALCLYRICDIKNLLEDFEFSDIINGEIIYPEIDFEPCASPVEMVIGDDPSYTTDLLQAIVDGVSIGTVTSTHANVGKDRLCDGWRRLLSLYNAFCLADNWYVDINQPKTYEVFYVANDDPRHPSQHSAEENLKWIANGFVPIGTLLMDGNELNNFFAKMTVSLNDTSYFMDKFVTVKLANLSSDVWMYPIPHFRNKEGSALDGDTLRDRMTVDRNA